MDARVHLKIKIKSLADEARSIRLEENKRKGLARRELQDHRKLVVRPEARATHLAYGYLRHMRYLRIEAKCYRPPNWAKVKRMVEKYGLTQDDTQSLADFKAALELQMKEFDRWHP